MTTLALIAALALAGQAAPPAPKPAPKPPADSAVSTVTVDGTRQAVETSIDRRSYSVANDLNGKTGTIGDVLRNVPSVQVDMQGNVSLRGDGNVTVLVDGRPSAQFSRENLAQALQSVPADQIDRIEVVTNPSAEFRADGTAGIINLVMKKARGAGRTGSVRVNAVSTGSYDGTVSGGFNDDKLSMVSSLSFRHNTLRTDGKYERTLAGGAGSTDIIYGAADPDGAQGRVGLDYDLDKTTRLSASVAGSWQGGTQLFVDEFTQVDGAGATVFAFDRRSESDIEGKNGQLDFTLRKKWSDSHLLTLNAAYSDNDGLNNRIDVTTPGVPAGPARAQQTLRNNHNNRAALTADYQKPVGGVQMKTGVLAEYIDNLIEHGGGSGPSASAISPIPGMTDNFVDVETHINAYVTLQKKLGKLTAIGGLRAEKVHLDLNQRTLGLRSEQDYEKLYPTLHLAYGLGEGKTLTASYSKRVSRPVPIDLDPFIFTTGPFNAVQGNPNLKPQDTDSYELIYETRKGQAFTLLTAYHRQSNNAFSNVLVDLGGGLLLQTRSNLGYQSSTGFEWAMGNRLSPKVTYNLSFNVFRTEIGGPGIPATVDTSAITGFGRANMTWQMTPKDLVQVNVFANSKQLLRQGYLEPSYSGNIGYRHTISDKLSMMVVVRDPFATSKYRAVLDVGGGRETRYLLDNTRSVTLGLVWNFAGKPRDTGFDFGPSAPAGGGL